MGRPEKFPQLRQYLEVKAAEAFAEGIRKFSMSFAEIEELGATLPRSAYNHTSWWYSRKTTRPWSEAHFKPEEVNLNERRLIFRYVGTFSAEVSQRKLDPTQKRLDSLTRHSG